MGREIRLIGFTCAPILFDTSIQTLFFITLPLSLFPPLYFSLPLFLSPSVSIPLFISPLSLSNEFPSLFLTSLFPIALQLIIGRYHLAFTLSVPNACQKYLAPMVWLRCHRSVFRRQTVFVCSPYNFVAMQCAVYFKLKLASRWS